jgi:hypothetical protein
MNINDDYQEDDNLSAIELNDACMDALFHMVIDPMQDSLHDEDLSRVLSIGAIFKELAKKAHAYDQLSSEGLSDLSRN